MVELALMTPLLFLAVINVINFGGFIFFWLTISDGARTVADSVSVGAASAGSPTPPSDTAIRAMLADDGATVDYCLTRNNTGASIPGNCNFAVDAVPPDPEGGSYTLLAVDVNYTYTPILQSFNFPSLGIYSTLPPTSIKRRAITRVAN